MADCPKSVGTVPGELGACRYTAGHFCPCFPKHVNIPPDMKMPSMEELRRALYSLTDDGGVMRSYRADEAARRVMKRLLGDRIIEGPENRRKEAVEATRKKNTNAL